MSGIEQDIEKYLSSDMTADQEAMFFEKIKNDPEARQLLESYLEMNRVYDQNNWDLVDHKSDHKKIKQYLEFFASEKGQTIVKTIKESEELYFSEKLVITPRFYKIVASIAAIIVIGMLAISRFDTTVDTQKLYASYKDWDSTLPSLTVRDTVTDISKVETLFGSQQYEEAITLIDSILSNSNDEVDFQLLMYKGVIYLENNNTSEALLVFKTILNDDTLDGAKAYWYIALCYLKEGDIDKTRDQLFKLINTTNFNKTKAKQLLELLR